MMVILFLYHIITLHVSLAILKRLHHQIAFAIQFNVSTTISIFSKSTMQNNHGRCSKCIIKKKNKPNDLIAYDKFSILYVNPCQLLAFKFHFRLRLKEKRTFYCCDFSFPSWHPPNNKMEIIIKTSLLSHTHIHAHTLTQIYV